MQNELDLADEASERRSGSMKRERPWSGGPLPADPMTEAHFASIRDLIYRKLGLHFAHAKVPFLTKRVEARMAALGLTRVHDYVFHLRFLDNHGREMQALANLITTNETYMFREYDQLQAFADYCLPEVLMRREASGLRRLRLWSAGCSSGEEPYTLAIILREVMHDVARWDIQILATDIDEVRLEMARRAVYETYAVREVPDEYAHRHLIEVKPGQYRIHGDTAKLVKVQHLNLHDEEAVKSQRDIDFIFCRNVLIYFDDASRKRVLDGFYECLPPGGFVYLGHSESVGRISPKFQTRRLGPHIVYWRDG